jgi:hypothetical protein
MTKSLGILSLGCHVKGDERTEWDFEFWCQLDGLSNLRYAAHRRKRLDENLLTFVA